MTKAISFYSTKRQANVEIPVDKVCGVRIPNSYMKKNYSDGVRTGANNGVVKQALSRFSTEVERKEATSVCAGNVNWLNYKRGTGFHKPEDAKNQFSIDRPVRCFNISTTADEIDDINQRNGMGNYEINRPSFISPPLKPRFNVEFDQLQLLSIQETGDAVGTLDGKLGYTTRVQIPDPTDFKWLREKGRLETILTARFTRAGFPPSEISSMVARELEINKPLGREQRSKTSTTNDIARNKGLATRAKITELIQEVRDGAAESRVGQQAITAQLVNVLQDTNDITNLSAQQYRELGDTMKRVGVPSNREGLGIVPTYADINFYNGNQGLVNLLLLNKVKEDGETTAGSPPVVKYGYNKPCRNFKQDPSTGRSGLQLTTMVTYLSLQKNERYFLDLDRGGVISLQQLKTIYKPNDPLFSITPSFLN